MLPEQHVPRTNRDSNNFNRKAGTVLFAETVSLGILSLPSVIASVGIVPGIVLIVVMAILSGYSGLVFGEFCRLYPEVDSFGGVGEIVGRSVGGPALGAFCKEFLGWGQTIFQIFVMGSHLLTFTIAMNTCQCFFLSCDKDFPRFCLYTLEIHEEASRNHRELSR